MEFCVKLLSLPLWERGLKLIVGLGIAVAVVVAPLVGAWIEICGCPHREEKTLSLPLWERGLKFFVLRFCFRFLLRRSPCGSVD